MFGIRALVLAKHHERLLHHAQYKCVNVYSSNSRLTKRRHIAAYPKCKNIICPRVAVMAQCAVLLCLLMMTVCILYTLPLGIGVGGYFMVLRGEEYEQHHDYNVGQLIEGCALFYILGCIFFANALKCCLGRGSDEPCHMFCGVPFAFGIAGLSLIQITNIYYGFAPLVFVIAMVIAIWMCVVMVRIDRCSGTSQQLERLKEKYDSYSNVKELKCEYYQYHWEYKLSNDQRFDYIITHWIRNKQFERTKSALVHSEAESLIFRYLYGRCC